MSVSDICSKSLVCVEPKAPLQNVAQLMKDHHVGCVVVVENNEKRRPIGMITDRDITVSVVAEGVPLTLLAEDIMSRTLVIAKRDEGIAQLIRKMADESIRRVIVVDNEENACGVVTSDDVLKLLSDELSHLSQLMQEQIKDEPRAKFESQRLLF